MTKRRGIGIEKSKRKIKKALRIISSHDPFLVDVDDIADINLGPKINLGQLLTSPSRDFLLAKDGNKVPISSLKDKVVGLYFCDNVPNPRRMEAIKVVYQHALDLSYDFEIVQINFHFLNKCKKSLYIEDSPLKPCCENIPWLTLPLKDSSCRRLRRVFRIHKYLDWNEDCFFIINPHEPNIDGTFLERFGADIVQHFGIEANPFTGGKVVVLEFPRRTQELKLPRILAPVGPPLLRRCGRRWDQVPVSQLYGKHVFIVFEHHSIYKSSDIVTALKPKYLKQEGSDDKFEIVFVLIDPNESTFDKCTRKMPWLVHPYSWEFACTCRAKIFGPDDNLSEYDSATIAFDVDGEFVAKQTWSISIDDVEDYPLVIGCEMEMQVLHDAR